MSKLLDKAISKLKQLPESRQDVLAEVILDLTARPGYALTDEQNAEVGVALEEADRGMFATDAQSAALWKKFGL